MYWVEWNTLKASPARKSREESSPATGLSWKPVVPGGSDHERSLTRSDQLFTFQEIRNSLKLGNLVLVVPAVLLQQREHVVVLVAGVALVESLQVVEDSPPGGLLLSGVLNARYLLAAVENI